MFCKRRYRVDPGNKEHLSRINALVRQRKYKFVVGKGDDVLKGWCSDARLENDAFLVLTDVILDMGRNGKLKEYQEHSELRFFNTPFGAFINEGLSGGEGERRAASGEE